MPFTPRCVLVTGGAGFIGSNFIRWLLEHDPHVQVLNYDLLTYAGNLENLTDVVARFGSAGEGRYAFTRGDVCDFEGLAKALRGDPSSSRGTPLPPPDVVVHFAAESHVDRSIMGPELFVRTNVMGTLAVMEACRAEIAEHPRPFRLLHVSTDEVYGSLGPDDPPFTERTVLAPNSPYAASKAASDLLVRGEVETFGLPAIISRCSNNYGPNQFPEKLIPLMITRALTDQPLPVYGDGLNVRDWVHVDDHASALWTILVNGRVGETYNVGGEAERGNIHVVRALLALLKKPDSLIQYVTDRPGHDRRYAMDTGKLRSELGWRPTRTFEEGLAATVSWYVRNPRWWERVLTEAYRVSNAMYLQEG